MLRQIFQQIALLLSRLPLFKRTVVILGDAIFTSELELVDNYSLFQFLVVEKQFSAYYIINSRHQRVEELKRKFGHRIITFNSEKRLSFYARVLALLPFARFWIDGYFLLTGPLKFLRPILSNSPYIETINSQHGVNFFKVGEWEKSAKTIGTDVYNCALVSTVGEMEFFSEQLHFSKNNLLLAGLSRWSQQCTSEKSVILVYFTWREYMRHLSKKEILETEYYKNINLFLSDNLFLESLKEHGFELRFALHHVLYEKGIADVFNNKAMLVDDSQLSLVKQKAFLLITDYSSMAFDFWYQNKGVLFLDIDAMEESNLTKRDKEAKVKMKDKLIQANLYHNTPEQVKSKIIAAISLNTVFELGKDNVLDPFLLSPGENCNLHIYNWLLSRK